MLSGCEQLYGEAHVGGAKWELRPLAENHVRELESGSPTFLSLEMAVASANDLTSAL